MLSHEGERASEFEGSDALATLADSGWESRRISASWLLDSSSQTIDSSSVSAEKKRRATTRSMSVSLRSRAAWVPPSRRSTKFRTSDCSADSSMRASLCSPPSMTPQMES